MAISAGDVKNLREMTGAGMMDCKKALSECNGDIEAAVDYLRKKGLAAAQKKQSRVAAEGAVVTIVEGNKGVIVEVNCETDFVSKGDDFQNFAKEVASYVLANEPSTVEALREAKGDAANELTLKCGEKIDLRRFEIMKTEGALGSYNHGGRIGVLVDVNTKGNVNAPEFQELIKDLAMHVAAAAPTFLTAGDIDEAFKKREADIYAAQLREEGKPEQMIEKIVEGKLKKLASEVCLLDQKFVKNPDLTVTQLLTETAKAVGGEIVVKGFRKLNLGEGIEKKEDNLADEVAKMTGQKQ
jgi:elongation factor Ts